MGSREDGGGRRFILQPLSGHRIIVDLIQVREEVHGTLPVGDPELLLILPQPPQLLQLDRGPHMDQELLEQAGRMVHGVPVTSTQLHERIREAAPEWCKLLNALIQPKHRHQEVRQAKPGKILNMVSSIAYAYAPGK